MLDDEVTKAAQFCTTLLSTTSAKSHLSIAKPCWSSKERSPVAKSRMQGVSPNSMCAACPNIGRVSAGQNRRLPGHELETILLQVLLGSQTVASCSKHRFYRYLVVARPWMRTVMEKIRRRYPALSSSPMYHLGPARRKNRLRCSGGLDGRL